MIYLSLFINIYLLLFIYYLLTMIYLSLFINIYLLLFIYYLFQKKIANNLIHLKSFRSRHTQHALRHTHYALRISFRLFLL